ncbi:helix-turn-helix domain-containing protein [Brevibacillus laterosporus]|uniref:helix-turn-helix domain-containing protein n=1 Tax=Brevibacillus laterosporus TaxID=1465 RepID=UPI001443A5DF|nr:helix-turn-helix domain-containing protein [Brevibacillus laterosporus]NKQ20524.1 helix-turn-helix domain-containing protein [Brevibacillus laterosporus]WNX32575.1 helix-turn-helix domain-containing protein [Brevibacillus laterosporus]
MNRLHPIAEVADVLGINKNAVYELIKHGHLKALKLGRLKVSTFELNDFMKRNVGMDLSNLQSVKELSIAHKEVKQ